MKTISSLYGIPIVVNDAIPKGTMLVVHPMRQRWNVHLEMINHDEHGQVVQATLLNPDGTKMDKDKAVAIINLMTQDLSE